MVLMLIIQKYKYWSFKPTEDYGSLPQPAGDKMQWQEVTNRRVGNKIQCTKITNKVVLDLRRIAEVTNIIVLNLRSILQVSRNFRGNQMRFSGDAISQR